MNRFQKSGIRELFMNRRHALLSYGLVILWIVFLSIGIWRHCHETVQVPIYDAFNYYEKAYTFWDAIRNHQLVNPLNLSPALRPPGTVLMSFPFGFDGNFHRFYFRSVMVPILLLVVAVYVVGWRRNLKVSQQWALALTALLLSSLPFFFHFEWSQVIPAITTWGIVDGFVGAVAALAVACMIRSLRYRSWTWWFATALFSNLTLFIKPAGALMMVAIGLAWFVVGGFIVWEAADRRRTTLFILSGGALLVGSFVASLMVCTHSHYLDKQIIFYMLAGQFITRQQQALPLIKSIRMVIGYVLPFLLLLSWISAPFILRRFKTRRLASKDCVYGPLIAAPGFFAVGVALWLTTPEPRYAFPFVLMAVCVMVPWVLLVVSVMPKWVNVALAILVLTQTVNLGALLLPAHPSARWQELSGVNLTSDGYRSEITAAKQLLTRIRAQGSGATVYSFYSGPPAFAFEAIGTFAAAFEPALPGFKVRLPVTWLTRHVFRLEQIIDSDYILFTPVSDAGWRASLLSRRNVADFPEESALFHAWFSERTEADGVQREFNTPDLRLLKVTDRRKLRKAVEAFLQQHSWPEFFRIVNPQHWWSQAQVESAFGLYPPTLRGVHFADRFTVSSIAVSHDGDLIVIRVWWKPNRSCDSAGSEMFFHFLDARGAIISAQTIDLADRALPGDSEHDVHLDVVAFPDPNSEAKTLGFGISVKGESLSVDQGKRDWGGKRIVLSLP
jgi:hypothetical protein